MKKLIMLVVLVALQGCALVELEEDGKQVRVVDKQHVEHCKRVGKTTVSVKSTVAGIDRKHELMQQELEILARNNAADLKGDTIVAITEIKDGKRAYDIYQCKQD